MAALSFGEFLRTLRTTRGLTQRQLAEASGLSTGTVESYEEGRRLPDAPVIDRLAPAMSLSEADHDQLRRAAGLRGLPDEFEAALRRGRGPVDTIWDEVQATGWVTLVVNERREIVAWNRLANRTSEIDLGSLTQFQRGLLRMASTPHYDRHLVNWDELIGRLISIFKGEGSDLSAGQSNLWVAEVLESIGRENPEFLPRIFDLFLSAEAWQEGMRNVHPVHWRLSDRRALHFWGVFADWSNYDGMWAFDWHAADAESAAWVQEQVAEPGGESAPPVEMPFAEKLRQERAIAHMSARTLAGESGLGASTIAAYEAGRRRPSRAAVLSLCRALNIDGYSVNRFLREFAYDEEPSDWARWLAGDTPISNYRNRTQIYEAGSAVINGSTNDLAWPSVVLDAGCHVVHANAAAERLAPLQSITPLAGRPGPHLMQLMVSDLFLESLRNWDDVAGVILPGRLEPLVLNAPREASTNNLLDVGRQMMRSHPAGLERLAAVWCDSPGFTSLRRPGVRFDWTTQAGEDLSFNCVITGISAADPYKALDLFPADPATFAWLGRG